MNKLFVVILALNLTSQAGILYMKGSVYVAGDPTLHVPNLYLDMDSQMPSEIFEGAEYYYNNGTQKRIYSVTGAGATYINGPFEVGESTGQISNWYTYNEVPDSTYHAPGIREGVAETDWYYGWLKWDGDTFIEYAINDTPNQHIVIGAIPEPSVIVLLASFSGGFWIIRRYFPSV